MKIQVKDIVHSRRFWAKDSKTGEVKEYKAWNDAYVRNGSISVTCTDSGDNYHRFDAGDALYTTKESAEAS
ncbi:hypothetical protein D3C76_363280 [compost metagenome]